MTEKNSPHDSDPWLGYNWDSKEANAYLYGDDIRDPEPHEPSEVRPKRARHRPDKKDVTTDSITQPVHTTDVAKPTPEDSGSADADTRYQMRHESAKMLARIVGDSDVQLDDEMIPPFASVDPAQLPDIPMPEEQPIRTPTPEA